MGHPGAAAPRPPISPGGEAGQARLSSAPFKSERTYPAASAPRQRRKRHRACRRSLDPPLELYGEGDLLSFEQVYSDGYGREQACYRLPKREAMILVTGYSVSLRAAVIDRLGKLKGNDEGKVVAQSWGVAHRFKRSYALAGGGYVATLPGTRRTRRLYGPAVGKEIIKGETAASLNTEAPRTVEACVLKRVARLL